MHNQNGERNKLENSNPFGWKSAQLYRLFIIFFYPILCAVIALKRLGIPAYRWPCWWYNHNSESYQRIHDGAASWRALYDIYTRKLVAETGAARRASLFWLMTWNAQAVRNRLVVTRSHLTHQILARSSQDCVNIFSIASGSAEAVFGAIIEARRVAPVRVQVFLLDRDPSALTYSRERAIELGLEDCLKTIKADIRDLEQVADQIPPIDVVEMVGFLDYRTHDSAVKLFQLIRGFVKTGGVFVTAQIAPNVEQAYITHLLDWPMIYRTPEEFEAIFLASGYEKHEVNIVSEPHHIHYVAVALIS